MKTPGQNFVIILVLLLSGLFFINCTFDKNESKNNWPGTWLGKLNLNGVDIRIVFRISDDKSGSLKAELDSPDQGAKGIHVDSVIVNDNFIRLTVGSISGYYEGEFNPAAHSIDGNWHQAGMIFPLSLKKVDKVEDLKRPQEPKPPFPYKAEDVVYDNKAAGIKLGGTLTMPESGGQFPAVILITGSGQQNRDEELMGHKPFLVLADYLTRKGIAVLRVDDRGIGESTGNFSASTTKDFSTDVLAGIAYLKSRKEIDQKEIGLIGHSEGGMIAPMVASESPDVAFIILMAGPGIPCDKLLLLQSAAIAKAEGASDEIIKLGNSINAELYSAIKSGKDSAATVEELNRIFDRESTSLSESEKSALHLNKANFSREMGTIMSPWFRYFISYDPAPFLERVKCPVLALNGSKDMQVLPDENLAGIKSALTEGGNKNFEIKKLNGLNHLFQTAETGSPAEYLKIEETISPAALKTMSDWILKITKK